MKIKTTSYRTLNKGKKDFRLLADISINLPDNSIIETYAEIQLHPIAYFYGKSPNITFSLLILSAIVYAVDRAVKRNEYSIDGWSREFEVEINIPEYEVLHPIEDKINSLLSFLTGDYWTCHFKGTARVNYPRYRSGSSLIDGITQVSLFSGGMDSLIGAIDYIENHPEGKLFLTSHYDSYMSGPKSDQSKLIKCFKSKYNGKYCYLGAVLVQPGLSNELSCRSRSLMFISLALIVAEYAACDVIVPENGSVSLNFPLSASRRASCSTRTTHPKFLRQLGEILKLIGIKAEVSNPYEKSTKGEMVQNCANIDYLIHIVDKSNSCGKRGMHQFMYDNHSATHCGHCMPCMYRKAALIGNVDNTTYGNRFITLFNKKGDKVAEDFYAMLDFLKKDLTISDIKRELRIAGMVNFNDLDDYANLVVRTRTELLNMIMNDNNYSITNYLGKI